LLYKARDAYLRWVARRHGLVVPSLVADRRVVDDSDAPAVLSSALVGLGEAEPVETSTKLELPEEAGV
jgi:hypothetical protein